MDIENESAALPDQVLLVLAATARVVEARLDAPVDAQRLIDNPDGIRTLLPLLTGSAGLRTLLRHQLAGKISTAPAEQLVSPQHDQAAWAANAVQQLLKEVKKAQRRAHRQERRANRPDAQSRRASRVEQRIAQLRATRDRLEQQVSTLNTENHELRSSIDNMDSELTQLRKQLEVAYSRLENAGRQSDRTAPEVAARTLTHTEDLSLNVQVLGGGTEIGGSCVLVCGGGTRLVVDAGTRPSGVDEASLAPKDIEELYRQPPDAIIVTHAHNDHGGWVPALVQRFPGIPVITSLATADLLGSMWTDSAKVMAKRAESDETWLGGLQPPYQQSDVDMAIDSLTDLPIGRSMRVGAFDVELFRAGHIVGATGVVITAGEKRVVVTGDVSGPGQLSVSGLSLPDSAVGADLMVLESTYAGAGKLPPRQAIVDHLISDIDQTLGHGGRVLVPAFALGRAQEVALICREHLPDAEVLIDGLARELTHAYQRHWGPDGQQLKIFNDRIRAVTPGKTNQEIATERPCVVIATSGMLAAGPSVAWATQLLTESRSRLAVVGYQDAESPGAKLLELANAGGGNFALPGAEEAIDVSAAVGRYSLGAHASEEDLVKISAQATPETLMLVHGRYAGQRQFAKRLELRQQRTILADRPFSL